MCAGAKLGQRIDLDNKAVGGEPPPRLGEGRVPGVILGTARSS